jgi:hypothetical protein
MAWRRWAEASVLVTTTLSSRAMVDALATDEGDAVAAYALPYRAACRRGTFDDQQRGPSPGDSFGERGPLIECLDQCVGAGGASVLFRVHRAVNSPPSLDNGTNGWLKPPPTGGGRHSAVTDRQRCRT